MAQIAVQPIVLRDVLLTVGTDDYEAHVSQVQFDPTSSLVAWKGLTPTAVFNFPTSSTWTCTLAYAQDWETEDSLSNYLYEHEGQEIACTFEPVKGGRSWEATLIIMPGAIGGTVDTPATGTVTLGVQGRPVPEAFPAP